MNNLLILTCLFGNQYKYVHSSTDNKNSYVFANNTELKDEIIRFMFNDIIATKEISRKYKSM